jgi:putative hydrolase
MSQNPFGDIPLFREIQRILASGEGPVNYEIGRQVAVALATEGKAEPTPKADDARELSDGLHAAEVLVSGYSRLPLDEPLGSQIMTRSGWVASTLDGWKWLLDHLATRFSEEMGRMGPEDAAGGLGAAVAQITPLLMGLQLGTLVGNLSREQLGRFDLPIPRDDDGRVFLVTPNVEAFGADYGLEVPRLIRWLALREASRGLIVRSVTWVDRYFRSLLSEIIDSVEIDASDLERRLVELQSQGMEALQEGLGRGATLPIVETERHRRALGRLHAFIALFEGYARHLSTAVGPGLLGDTTRIDESMARHGLSHSDAEEMLADLLGLSLDRSLETTGTTFCSAVVKLKGMDSLNRVWEAPDNLPVLAEIKDPFQWIERVLPE